jgi:hypothetical protein
MALIHPGNDPIIKQRRIENQAQVKGIPPSIENVGCQQQPRQPQPTTSHPRVSAENHQKENAKGPGMEKHGG